MDKERAYIMGELEFETGNIEIKFEGKRIGHMILVATIIKNISEKTGVSTTKIMKDITTLLESITADERTEEE